MAFSAGHKAYVGLDNAAGSVQNVSQYADNFSVPNPTDTLETTTFGTNAVKTFVAGLNGGASLSISGPLDPTFHTQISAMKTAQTAGTASFTLLYGPAGSVASSPSISVEVLVSDYTVSTGVSGRGEFSASLQATGVTTSTTF